MKRKRTGLFYETFTFRLDQKDEYEKAKAKLQKKGKITELFVDNALAFEIRYPAVRIL